MKKIRRTKKLELTRVTLSQISGGATNSDLYCTVFGICPSVPPQCPTNWITHCTVNTDTGYSCLTRCNCEAG